METKNELLVGQQATSMDSEVKTHKYPTICINVITATDGALTVKTIKGKKSAVEKIPGGSVTHGVISTLEMPLDEYVYFAVNLNENQMVVGGTAYIGKGRPLLSKREWNRAGEPSDVARRTKDCLDYIPGKAGIVTLDHDPSLFSHYVIESPSALSKLLVELFPEVFTASTSWGGYYSSGSYIYKDDELVIGANGHHTVYPAEDSGDIPRFREVLFDRLWLHGYGYIYVTKSGSMLTRTIFDKIVLQPQQPIFSGPPICLDGFEQRRPEPVCHAGNYLDTSKLPDLSSDEQDKLKSLIAKAKRQAMPKAERQKEVYLSDECESVIRAHCERGKTISKQKARKIVESRFSGTLAGNDLIYFDSREEPVSVAEILANPEEYDDETCADPIEPEYGGGVCKAKLFINEDSGSPVIHSFARGGRVFKLKHDYQSACAFLENLKSKYGNDAVVEKWKCVYVSSQMEADEHDLFLRKVKDLIGVGIMQLRSAVRGYQREYAREELAQSAGFDHLEDGGDYVAQALLHERYRNGDLLMQTEDDSYWRYTGRYWERVQDNVLKSELQTMAKKRWVSIVSLYDGRVPPLTSIVDQSAKVLGNHVVRPGDPLHSCSPRPPVINCANGELWLTDEGPILKPHDPKSGLTWCSDIHYEPAGMCPTYDKLMRNMFCRSGGDPIPDQAEMLRHMDELMGYMIQPDRFIKTFYIWMGEGDNGKSVLVKLIQNLIGHDAGYMGRLDRMEDDKLRLAELHQKLFAIDDDAGRDCLFPDGFAKKASEQKTVTAQYKHKDHFNYVLQVVLLFMSNHWISVRDLSRGLQTRAQVVKFPRTFLRPDEAGQDNPDIQRPDLWKKVFEEEMPGVLNRLIPGFYRLKERGSFDPPASCKYAKEEWLQNANTVARFVEEGCEKDAVGLVDLRELRDAYVAWCDEEGIQPRYVVTKNNIRKHLLDLGFEISVRNGYPHIIGLKITFEKKRFNRYQ